MTLDLHNNLYDRETLKKYIYTLNMWDILKTQKIDALFACSFVLNKNYQFTPEEEKIKIEDVLHYQQHISRYELMKIYTDVVFNIIKDEIDDFETVSKT